MSDGWLTEIPTILIAAIIVLTPGLIVRLAGWNARQLTPYFLVPAFSLAIIAVAANAAPVVGLDWSPVPVVIVTLIAAGAAALLRRWAGQRAPAPTPPRAYVVSVLALAAAALVIGLQLAFTFVEPRAISQTFDNIVHLNAIRLADNAADASGIQIGATSDIGFYPDAWHSVVTMVIEVTGASIPVGVNVTNIVVGAVLWPFSCLAITSVLFRERPLALVVAAGLSTGFGAFPLLLFDFGVLYPNAVGYSLIPAALAAVVLLLRAPTWRHACLQAVALLTIVAGVALAHPNAFLAVYALGTGISVAILLERGRQISDRGSWLVFWTSTAGMIIVGVILWSALRTNYPMSRWPPWQTAAQAIGEVVVMAPRQFPMTLVLSILMIIGFVAVIRRPRDFVVAVPFVVGAVLYVLASGTAVSNPIREFVVNPWYNDPYRLAALLPAVAVPVATLGALALVDLVSHHAPATAFGRFARVGGVSVLVLAVYSVALGPNVVVTATEARQRYVAAEDANLLSPDERALLERLDETTSPDARILGNPQTGASLALALANRSVTERHIFGARSPSEEILVSHLNEIESDPRVCDAIREEGVDYVLDFGDRTVNDIDSSPYGGFDDLAPSDRLILVDSEGDDARLFRVEGC